jgi:hypothetical protein
MFAYLYQYYIQANLNEDSGCFVDALIVHCQESNAQFLLYLLHQIMLAESTVLHLFNEIPI